MDLSQYNCLFVDDEKPINRALSRALRSEPYECRFAGSGFEALEMLTERPADVVVSDMRMPKMNGVELLRQVAAKYPKTIRLVLSGWANPEEILNAVNEGHIYRYIVKPWDDRELKTVLRQALEIRILQDEKQALMDELKEHNRDLEKLVEERTAQLLKISNHAEIGKYASQIVHDLNNPLHAISGVINLLLRNISKNRPMDDQEISTWLDMAKRGVKDLNSIISGILLHARDRSRFEVDQVDINALIQQELKFFELDRSFKEDVEKKLSLDADLPAVPGHSVQIKQVFDNLIRNAWDAMADAPSKRLTISTTSDRDRVIITVGDTGEGIDASYLERIFNPDFTTKPVGKGTGLGLASVKTMVDAYAGEIEVASERGRGTTFTVKLPLTGPIQAAAPGEHPSP